MLSHQEMIGLQSEKHDLIDPDRFATEEQFVLHLIHTAAYVHAARIASGRIVLDLGCNTGYGTEIVSRSASRIVGVDVSPVAIEAARARYASKDLDFRLIDGTRLPFDDGEFDLIVSCQVIEHVVDHAQFVLELKRVLSPSGIVMFTTPNAALRLDPGMKPWNPFHVREYLADELEEALSPYFSGLEVLGLFASESIYRVEKTRLDNAREQARIQGGRPAKSLGARVRQTFKSMLPGPLLNTLRVLRNRLSPTPENAKQESFPTHRLDEIYYRKDDRDSALDLMVLCSDDEQRLAKALAQFEKI